MVNYPISNENIERMKTLVQECNRHAHLYYVKGTPEIRDEEFDQLYEELVLLEEQTGIILEDSPTQRVGGDILAGFEKIEHAIKMLSLEKAKDEERLRKFDRDTRKGIKDGVIYSLELKIDGLATKLYYDLGKLVQAGTRGNGVIGEDITENIKTIKSVPLTIPFQGKLEVVGEPFMYKEVFERLNAERQKQGEEAIALLGPDASAEEVAKLKEKFKPFQNTRNAGAGSLKNLDPKVTASRNMDAFWFGVTMIEGKELHTQKETLEFLKEQGFKVNPYYFESKNIEDIIAELPKIAAFRSDLPYDIDGTVIKVSQATQRDLLGETGKHPKWAISYKFESLEATTAMIDCIWETGRTGRVNPTGIVEEVPIGGTKVKRFTLNNPKYIREKGAKIGALVKIRRSNDVIPELVEVIDDSNGKEIEIPTHCPSCGSSLEWEGDMLFCRNVDECSAQFINKLIHFGSRDAMNIEEFGDKTAELLFHAGLVKSLDELYQLTKEDLLTLEGFAEKSAQNLLDAIEKSKERPLDAFFYALGIRNAGKGTAERLFNYYETMEKLMEATVEELMQVEDVGPIVGQSIYDFFHHEKNMKMIDNLKKIGVKMERKKAETASSSLEGLVFVLTGTMDKMGRKEMEQLIKSHGGKTSGSVSKKTNYVVVGFDSGSKEKKADELGITKLSEYELYSMMGLE